MVARFVLPYSLNLVLHAERRDPTHLETSLTGALEGVVRWYLTDLGSGTRMDFEQDVQLTGRLLRLASRAGRPLLALEPRVDDEGRPGRAARPAGMSALGAAHAELSAYLAS